MVRNEDLKRTTRLPLPLDELLESGDALKEAAGTTATEYKSPKTWRSRISNSFRAVRIPSWKPRKDGTLRAEESPTVVSKEDSPIEARSYSVGSPVETVEYVVAENLVRVTTKELPKEEVV